MTQVMQMGIAACDLAPRLRLVRAGRNNLRLFSFLERTPVPPPVACRSMDARNHHHSTVARGIFHFPKAVGHREN